MLDSSILCIKEDGHLSCCRVSCWWSLGAGIVAQTKGGRKENRKGAAKVIREWHEDDRKLPKFIVKNLKELVARKDAAYLHVLLKKGRKISGIWFDGDKWRNEDSLNKTSDSSD